MMRDTCIVVNEHDQVIGNGTKKDCHVFTEHQSGILHRAFSVFLFDHENRLLLQKRAPQKFTFPENWTNTCCSHPLYGFDPSEVDTPDAILNGTVPGTLPSPQAFPSLHEMTGIKTAARRKLNHELGIPLSQIHIQDFKYLTRLHYCAPDAPRAGYSWSWGEHEMDYILFMRQSVDLHVNAEEVCDHKYVDQEELREMMEFTSGLKWTPWFRIIAQNFLFDWWRDLDRVLSSDAFVDLKTIHRLSTHP